MARKLWFCAALLTSGAVAPACGQENLLGELYGLGVHAYNSGDYREAYANLSAAVEGGSRDPRVYYFRGLALANLGRTQSAQADFAKGAKLEAAAGGDQYAVGRALERIQGTQRLAIERIRKVEKIKFQQDQLARDKAMYEQRRIKSVEPVLPSSDEFATRPVPKVDTAKPVEGDPFGAGDGLGVGAAEKAPPKAEPGAVAGSADPFGTGGAEAPAAGTSDPFGGDTPSTPAGDADPFGGGAPAAGDADPFGGGAPAAGGGDDPFGGDAPAAGEKPAVGGGDADPFGGAEGAAPPAGDDPFGGEPAGGPPAVKFPAGGAPPRLPPAGAGGPVGGVVRGIGQALQEAAAPDNRDPFEDTDEPKAGPPAPIGRPALPPAGGAPAGDPFGDDPAPPAAGDPLGAAEPEMEAEPPAGGDPFAE